MPHLLVDRPRLDLFTGMPPKRTESSLGVVVIELLDIVAALCCLAGGACFMPDSSESLTVFLHGCGLFICGSAVYVFASCLAFCNSWTEKGLSSRETGQSLFYLAAALIYCIGTVLYWPSLWQTGSIAPDQWMEVSHHKSASLQPPATRGAASDILRHRALAGSIFSIGGAALLAAAAFLNTMYQQTHNDYVSKLLIAISSFYMLGSVFLMMSAAAFLPNLGSGAEFANIGSRLLIVGSAFYLIGGVLSMLRTAMILNEPSDSVYGNASLERDPLIAYRSMPARAGTAACPARYRMDTGSAGQELLGGTYRSVVPSSVAVPPGGCAP